MASRLLIWNGASGKAQSIGELLKLVPDVEELEMTRHLDLGKVIADAVSKGCETVIAAGGDGTVNAIVNGIMQLGRPTRPKLAIIPLGTANDFAGTLEIPDRLEDAAKLISDGESRPTDVVRIHAGSFERYFANVAAGGNSVRVSEELTDELKAKWGAFCYIRGAIGVLADMDVFHIAADCDGEKIETDCWAVIVANGKTNAGRIVVGGKKRDENGKV